MMSIQRYVSFNHQNPSHNICSTRTPHALPRTNRMYIQSDRAIKGTHCWNLVSVYLQLPSWSVTATNSVSSTIDHNLPNSTLKLINSLAWHFHLNTTASALYLNHFHVQISRHFDKHGPLTTNLAHPRPLSRTQLHRPRHIRHHSTSSSLSALWDPPRVTRKQPLLIENYKTTIVQSSNAGIQGACRSSWNFTHPVRSQRSQYWHCALVVRSTANAQGYGNVDSEWHGVVCRGCILDIQA